LPPEHQELLPKAYSPQTAPPEYLATLEELRVYPRDTENSSRERFRAQAQAHSQVQFQSLTRFSH
jgi:hypothetical protein